MHFIYIDDSGDPGNNTKYTASFVLSGLIIPINEWDIIYRNYQSFRNYLKSEYSIPLRVELHATDIWKNSGDFVKINLSYADRRHLFIDVANYIRKSRFFNILNIRIDKSHKNISTKKISIIGFNLIYQRFENWLSKNNSQGIIVQDEGYRDLSRKLLRKMKIYNPIPSLHKAGYYQNPLTHIIEDPFERQSMYSFAIQLSDIISYLIRLRWDATLLQKVWGLHKLYKKMKPRYVLEASRKDNYGMVIYP